MALEARVAQLEREVAETDARCASDDAARMRFRRALVRHRLGAGTDAGGESVVEEERLWQEGGGVPTEADLVAVVKGMVVERQGGADVDLAEARARVQCRFAWVPAADLDTAADLEAAFDAAFAAASAEAAVAQAKGGAGRAEHVRALLSEYGVGAEETEGLGLEALEQLLEREGQEGRD